VVRAIGVNVSDLVEVLCGPSNAELFLKFGGGDASKEEEEDNGGDDTNNNEDEDGTNPENNIKNNHQDTNSATKAIINATQESGPLATLLLSCAYGLPLQTPSYAALTLGVDVEAPKPSHGGFAARCLTLGMRCLGRDLDMALECTPKYTGNDPENRVSSSNHTASNTDSNDASEHAKVGGVDEHRCPAETTGGYGNGSQIDAYYRCKFLLRYLAHLTKIGIVSSSAPFDGAAGPQSLLGLLQMMVESASLAARASGSESGAGNSERGRALGRAARILASLVLSTVPYAVKSRGGADDGDESRDGKGISSKDLMELVDALDNNVVGQGAQYSSEYEPGAGPMAVLLKGELDDVAPDGVAGEDGDEDDDEDDDEEEEDDGDRPAPCADTLQDLLRTVRKLISSSALQTTSPSTRFALLDDAPWDTLKMTAPSNESNEGMETEAANGINEEKVPMTYMEEQLLLDLMGGEEKRCKSIPYLLSLEGSQGSENDADLKCRSLHGIVFGRLNIFDAPPDADEDDDDDEGDDAETEANPNLESYVKTFSLADRFFLSDAVRDILMCHRPMVSDAGADRSSAKEVAEQIWAISHLFRPPPTVESNDDASAEGSAEVCSKGIEYGIIETLMSLIVQCTAQGSGIPSSSPLQQHLYLSRVLLELTKLKPSLVPPAIVLAISGLFQDFLPSLTPTARENLGLWLAFHLTNTEYQWPKAYWDHWAPYAAVEPNSRGAFIATALRGMAALSSEGAVTVVNACLPPASPLVQSVFLDAVKNTEKMCIEEAEKDLVDRMWNSSEDTDFIRQHIISDELSESHGAAVLMDDSNMHHPSVWWRCRMAARAVLYPYVRDSKRTAALVKKAVKQHTNGNDAEANNMSDEDIDETEDLLTDVTDAIARFKSVMLAALAKDAETYQERVESENGAAKDDDQLLLAGEVSLMEVVSDILISVDSVDALPLIESFLKHEIVSGFGLTTWVLGEYADVKVAVPSNWWKFVSLAVQNCVTSTLKKLEKEKTDLGGGIGMIIDDSGVDDEDAKEAAVRRLDEVTKATVPILTYVVERACNIIASIPSETKKIPTVGANLIEGIKQLVRAAIFHLNSSLLESSSSLLTAQDLLNGLASMDANGEKLASICQSASASCEGEQGKKTLQSLSTSLEKIL